MNLRGGNYDVVFVMLLEVFAPTKAAPVHGEVHSVFLAQ